MKLKKVVLLSFILGALSSFGYAKEYSIPSNASDVVGAPRVVYAQNESFVDLSIRYEAGIDELSWANPDVNKWTPSATTPIILPFQYILPAGKREGIISNIPELRTYYFPKDRPDIVYVYPISVGRMDWKTPLGSWKVTVKQQDPAWYPPPSIRKEHAEDGRELGGYVPPGPDNPLGRHVLRLSIPSYLLHGTNDPSGIGMRVTHGCMRFFPADIEELYRIVPSGTTVTFTNQPVKIGWNSGELMMEVHPPLEEDNLGVEDILNIAHQLLQQYQNDQNISLIDMNTIDTAIRQMSGLPIYIGSNSNAMESNTPSSSLEIDWDNFKK